MKFAIFAAVFSASALAAPAGGLVASDPVSHLVTSAPTYVAINSALGASQQTAFSQLKEHLQTFCSKQTAHNTRCMDNFRALDNLSDAIKLKLLAAAVDNEQGVLKALGTKPLPTSSLNSAQEAAFKQLTDQIGQFCASQVTQNEFCFDAYHALEKFSDANKIALLQATSDITDVKKKAALLQQMIKLAAFV